MGIGTIGTIGPNVHERAELAYRFNPEFVIIQGHNMAANIV